MDGPDGFAHLTELWRDEINGRLTDAAFHDAQGNLR